MRKALLVCTTFVAVAAALAGVLLAYTQTDAFRAWLRGKIWAALDESIDREFSLGELRGNPVTGVVLEDFRIALWDSLRGGELLSAAQVKARYNLLDLLRGRLLVRSLVLESPSIQLERTGDGIWNSASLLARREGGVERPYRIQVPSVRVHDLRLVIVQPSRTDSLVAEGISGALDIANHEGRIHGTANGLRVGPIGLDVTALLTDVAYDRERVSINSLTLDGRRIRLRLEGTFFPGPGKLDFTLAESSLESESLWSLLAPGQKPRLSGTVKFAGRLRGSVKAPDLEGSLQMLQGSLDARSLENLRARISYRDRELSVSGLDGRVCGSRMTGFLKASSFPPSGAKPAQILGRIEVRDLDITRLSSSVPPHLRSRITGSVVLRGGARDDGRFRIHVGLSLTSGVVDRYRFDSLAALAVISQEGAEISDFRLTQGNAFVSAHGEVYPGGLSLNVESSEIDLEEVAGMAGLTGVSGRLHLQGLVTGKPSDPGLVGALWIRDGSIRGARFAYLEGSVSARNLRTGFRGEATVTAWGARFLGGEGLNRMECRVISEETGRNRFVLSGQRDSSTWLEVEGTWSPGPDSQAVNVERIAGLWRGGGIRNTSPVHLMWQRGRLTLSDLGLLCEGAEISASGWAAPGDSGSFAARVDLRNLDLTAVARVLDKKWPARGVVEANLEISGTAQDPQLQARFSAVDLSVGMADARRLDGEFTFKDRRLRIGRLSLERNGSTSEIRATVPLDPALAWKERRLPDEPLEVEAVLRDPGLWVFYPLRDLLAFSQGKVGMNLQVSGTPAHPRLKGEMTLDNGRLIIRPFGTPVARVQAFLRLGGDTLLIQSLTGVTPGGPLQLDGPIVLSPAFVATSINLVLQAEGVPVHNLKDMDGRVNAAIFVSGDGKRPRVEGTIEVVSGELTIPFGVQDEESQIVAASGMSLDYDLLVFSDRNVWLRNADARVELGIEDLAVRQQHGEFLLSGVLESIQGVYYYLSREFEITSGRLRFTNSPVINPELEFQAQTVIHGSTPDDRTIVYLALTGTMKEPVVQLSSDPPLSEQDIIVLLNLDMTWDEFRQAGLSGIVIGQTANLGLSYAERRLADRLRRSTGLDAVRLKTDLVGLGESSPSARLTVGKYLSRNLYLDYSHDLFALTGDQFRVEYFLSRGLGLFGERDEDGCYSLGGKFRLKY